MTTYEFYVLSPFSSTDRGTFETRTSIAETQESAFDKLQNQLPDAVVVFNPLYSQWDEQEEEFSPDHNH